MDISSNYIESIQKQLSYYKSLGEKTFEQLTDEQIHWKPNDASNSIAIVVKHIVGNMLSRFTNFYTEDGEKEWRNRDTEFEDSYGTKEEMLRAWEEGWEVFLHIIDNLKPEDLSKMVYIRNQGHTVLEALNRQLCHYSYHIGQLVFVGRLIRNNEWISLSIPKNHSKKYNEKKFAKSKERRHFTDDL